jgi:hypothetical protein
MVASPTAVATAYSTSVRSPGAYAASTVAKYASINPVRGDGVEARIQSIRGVLCKGERQVQVVLGRDRAVGDDIHSGQRMCLRARLCKSHRGCMRRDLHGCRRPRPAVRNLLLS